MTDYARSFAIPYNNQPDFVGALLNSRAVHHVRECYGSDGLFGSGRSFQTTEHNIIPVIKALAEQGISFNYLLNALSADEYWIDKAKIIGHVRNLVDSGVKTLTISHPFLVQEIQHRGIQVEISSSVNQFIRSSRQAKELESVGYKRIIIDEDELRNLSLIRSIRSVVRGEIEVLVNNACLFRCPNRITHQSFNRSGLSYGEIQKACATLRVRCTDKMNSDLLAFLETNWVRPEDLNTYRSLGVSLFKLTGRTISTRAIVASLEIYASESHEGTILDYVRPERRFRGLQSPNWLTKEVVQPYLEHVFSGCARDNCKECESIVRVIEAAIPDGGRFEL